MSRKFYIGDVLSITTGRLYSPRHIEGIYDILNYMTRDNLFTHQLPRAADECKPWILRQHPNLASFEVPPEPPKDLKIFLQSQAKIYGEFLEIEPIPRDDHTRKDAMEELEEMVGKDRVVVAELPPED